MYSVTPTAALARTLIEPTIATIGRLPRQDEARRCSDAGDLLALILDPDVFDEATIWELLDACERRLRDERP